MKNSKRTTNMTDRNSRYTRNRLYSYAVLNFLILVVVFATMTFTIFLTSNSIVSSSLNKELKDTAYSLKSITKESFDNGMVSVNTLVVFYDKYKKPILNYGKYEPIVTAVGEIGMIGEIVTVHVSTVEYRMFTIELDNGDYVKVATNVEQLNSVMKNINKSLIFYLIIGSLIMLAVSLALAYFQVIPHKKAIDNSTRFTSDVSHELNTPLSIVQTNLQNILDEPTLTVDEVSGQLVVALNEIKRLKKLTKELLILSRSDQSKLVPQNEPINLYKIFDMVCEPYAMICEMQDKIFEKHIDKSVDTLIYMDKDLITQVITSLMDNAIKYTEKYEKVSLISLIDKNILTITVCDSGTGVNDDELEKIFTRFYRSEKSRTSEGTGLGLSIVHAIIVSLGGNIIAQNIKPKGFSVDITIPIKEL